MPVIQRLNRGAVPSATPCHTKSEASLPCRSRGAVANANPAAVLFNKLHARFFQAAAYYVKGGAPRLMTASFQLTNRDDTDFRFIRELLLAPIQKPPGSSALGRGNHSRGVPQSS